MPRPLFMLDTNICIYIQRQKPAHVLERFQALNYGEAVISLITWGELLYGAAKSQQRERVLAALEDFSSLVPVLPMSPDCGKVYGEIRAGLERNGLTIGNNDLWIAAHAISAGVTLVTHNTREFYRVPGLKVEDWV
jgi:tRNA(fMet)-specific endonuclease VapC